MATKFFRAGVVAFLGAYAFAGAAHCFAAPASRSGSSKTEHAAAESADAHIVDVVAITRVFADGMKVSAVAVQYDKSIRDASLKPADFAVTTGVPTQKITRVYTSADGLPTTTREPSGKYVILELSTDYVIPVPAHKAPAPPPTGRPPMASGPRPEPAREEVVLNPEVKTKVGDISWDPAAHPATLKSSKHGGNGQSVSVSQVGQIATNDGETYTATTAPKDNVYVRNLIVDGFMKPDFATAHGNVKYNIHFPSNYDPGKKYPAVVFIDDSDSPSGFTHAEFLIHGLGGVVWADKEDEARHAAIVIVPALPRPLINESYEPTVETRPGGQTSTPYLSILDLVDGLTEKIPSIDKNRIYLTGQGDGARAAIRMMQDRPDLYAAALLFAPDYDASKVSQLSKARMWIVVSEGDPASYSSMKSSVANLQAAGARVSEAVWNGDASDTQLASDVRGMAAQGRNIDFTVLKKGTVVPSGLSDDATDNHAYTWRIGYSIPALRDWLFTQSK